MKISDIVKCVATYLARENVLKYLNGETENLGDAKEQIDTMVRCSNLVINELASSYIPMIKIEKCSATDGKIFYGSLSERALEIISVKTETGGPVKFSVNNEYIETAVSPVVVTYRYLPANYDLEDQVGFDATVTERAIAYGVTAEICLIERNFDESVAWRKRYTQSIEHLVSPKNFVMPKRRWA